VVDMSMGVRNPGSLGKRFVEQYSTQIINDPLFDLDIKRRQAKLATFDMK